MLADCVPMFSNGEGWLEGSKDELISYVKSISEVCEVRAVAYHDVAQLGQDEAESNLFRAWLLTHGGQEGESGSSLEASAVWKSKFIDFIEEHCR